MDHSGNAGCGPPNKKNRERSDNVPNNRRDDDSSMCGYAETTDDIALLKDLFFNLKTSTRTDWSNINIEKRHDFKFWADVTHNFGFDILKCVFGIGTSYCDNHVLTTYYINSVYGDELRSTSNYVMSLKNEVAFHLLNGMIENRVPGSLRLIIRGNGFTFFENRINDLLNTNQINHDALCHNMNALNTLFPYLMEYESVNLSQLCFQFVTSKLWKYMWAYIGINLKGKTDDFNEKLFLTFLDLSTTIIYGSRGPGFLKRLHTSSSRYFWNSVLPLVSWSMEKRILCKIVSFISDILLLSVCDGCHETIPADVYEALKHNVNLSLHNGKSEGYGPFEGLSNNDFKVYYSNTCVVMLMKLEEALSKKIKEITKSMHTIYEISTLGSSKLTIPYNCKNVLESDDNNKTSDFTTTPIFPRILPCFNFNCHRVYHIDLPQIHVVNNDSINFFYCKKCGIPSYCSERCYNEHWRISHKDICPYFMNFPTFAKYMPKSDMSILSTVDQWDFNCVQPDSKNNWNPIF
ncbi:hypothetical protein MACK_001927 [Theileria orientalis]|uniref:MYND-type domain-containing protein n=1 Tax=Theileria orientalis TaxID=68886 RepID=A0A976MAU0_THEOR|nr:hypothetical protein MACK_001927 [Theileria orientalis]